jgi:hypothetical protein
MQEISWLAKEALAGQEQLYIMESGSWFICTLVI